MHVELEALPGARFLGRVSTEDAKEISGATAILSWKDDRGEWTQAKISADEAGYFDASCAPAGSVAVRYKAPGYFAEESYEVLLPNTDDVLWIALKPSDTLLGRVLLDDGRPASRFDVLAWRVDEPSTLQRHEVQSTREGEFVFEDAPRGEIYVLAVSDRCPGSNVVRVDTDAGDPEPVTLTLSEPIPLTGIVVDAETDLPIHGAEVQLMVSSPDGAISSWGPPHRSDVSGTFLVRGAIPTKSWILVSAPDHADLFQSFLPSGDGIFDLGKLGLRSVHPLTVRLLESSGSALPPAGSSDWEVYTFGSTNDNPHVRVGPTGVVEFQDIGPGFIGVGVQRHRPDSHHWIEQTLSPNGPWSVDLIASGGRSVEIELIDSDGSPYRGRAYVIASVDRGNSQEFWQFALENGALASTGGIYADSILVKVLAEDYRTEIGKQRVVLTRDSQHVQVHLGGARATLKVVRADGVPVAGARVSITEQDADNGQSRGTTDEEGAVLFLLDNPAIYIASVLPDEGGIHDGLRVDFRVSNEAQVEIGATGDLVVYCHDDNTPLQGVEVTVFGSLQTPWTHARSDSDAKASFVSFGQGRYLIQLLGDDIWTSEEIHAFTPGEGPLVQQAYRLGALDLSLVDGNGGALVGVPVELTWVERGENVGDWIEDGRLEEGDLVTGSSGHLRLEGVPRGRYAWRAETATGTAGAGELIVPAGGVGRVVGTVE